MDLVLIVASFFLLRFVFSTLEDIPASRDYVTLPILCATVSSFVVALFFGSNVMYAVNSVLTKIPIVGILANILGFVSTVALNVIKDWGSALAGTFVVVLLMSDNRVISKLTEPGNMLVSIAKCTAVGVAGGLLCQTLFLVVLGIGIVRVFFIGASAAGNVAVAANGFCDGCRYYRPGYCNLHHRQANSDDTACSYRK